MMTHRTGLHAVLAMVIALVAVLIIQVFGEATTSELIGWFVFFAFIQFGVVRTMHRRRCGRCTRDSTHD